MSNYIFLASLGFLCVIVPFWNLALSISELLDAKRDRILCNTIYFVRDRGIPLASLPPKLARKIR